MKQYLRLRRGVCPFRKEIVDNIDFGRRLPRRKLLAMTRSALKLFILSFPLLKRITYNVQPMRRGLCALKPYASYLIPAATAAMILFCVCLVHAGQRENIPVATGVALRTDTITPLKIGDTIPQALWNLPLQMVKAGQEGSTTVTLKDYKGKLIILDFWATWCGACIMTMPKLDSLRQQFGSAFHVVMVTKENLKKVANTFGRSPVIRNLSFPFLLNDTVLNRLFPHKIIPHEIWVDKQGVVRAITGYDDVNAKNVEQICSKGIFPSREKKDEVNWTPGTNYKRAKADPRLLFKAQLTKRDNAIPSGSFFLKDKLEHKPVHISFFNYQPIGMYYHTMMRCLDSVGTSGVINPERIIVELHDSLLIKRYANASLKLAFHPRKFPYLSYHSTQEWYDATAYNFELTVPQPLSLKAFQQLVFTTLNGCFPFKGSVEKRPVQSLIVFAPDKANAEQLLKPRDIYLKGIEGTKWFDPKPDGFALNNSSMSVFIDIMKKYPIPPIFDETGIMGNIYIDISFKDSPQWNNSPSGAYLIRPFDVKTFREQLVKYGLDVRIECRMVDMLIISDK